MTSDVDPNTFKSEVVPEVPSESAPKLENGAEADAKAAALAAIAKIQANMATKVEPNDAVKADPPDAVKVENDVEPKPERKKRFGPPANAPREIPKKKRKSRWEKAETSTSSALIVQNRQMWPTDVTLPGGVTVCSMILLMCL